MDRAIPQLAPSDVRAWREKHHYTGVQLAATLGIDPHAVYYWEGGAGRVPPWYVAAVLHYLVCVPEDAE